MDADLFTALQSLRSPEEAPPASSGGSPPDIREVRSAFAGAAPRAAATVEVLPGAAARAAAASGLPYGRAIVVQAVVEPEPKPKRAKRAPATLVKQAWSRAEDELIIDQVAKLGTKWAGIAQQLVNRTDDAVRNRYLRLKRKKGDEGEITSADLELAEPAKKGDMWTAEEDATILAEVRRSGFRWQDIARILPGRSANAVRNRFLRFPAETRRAADAGELLTMGADANTAIPLPAAVAHPIAPIGVGWEPSNPHAAAVASMPAAVAVAAIPAAVLQLTPGVQYTGFPLHGQIV